MKAMKIKKLNEVKNDNLWQWKTMEYLSYALVFAVPLYFNNKYNLFTFSSPKTILLIGIVLIMTILYAWGVFTQKKLSFRITSPHIISLIFLIIITISSVFGIDQRNSFFGRWQEGVSLILIYVVVIFAFLIGFLAKKNKNFLLRILTVSFISSICVAGISYLGDYIMPFLKHSSDSTLGNSSYTGSYLLFTICFGIGLFFYHSKLWQKLSITIGTLFILFCPIFFNMNILLNKLGFKDIINNPFSLLGEANGAIVGLGISILFIVCFSFIFSSRKFSKIVGVILLFSLLGSVIYAGNQLMNPTSKIHKIYIEQKTGNRLIAWEIAGQSFIAHPLLGSGFNNYSYNYQKYFTSDIMESKYPEAYFNQPHNVFWEYASNNGILGLISYLSLLIFTFIALFQCKEDEDQKYKIVRITLIGILFGYFVQNLFIFDTPVTYLMLFLVVGLAIGLSKNEWNLIVPDKQKFVFKIILTAIIITSIASIVLFVILPMREFRQWGKVVTTNSIKERITLREGLQGISLFGGVYDSAYLAEQFSYLYQKNLDKINSSNQGLYLEEIDSIVEQVEKDIERQPYDVGSHLIVGRLLNMRMIIKGTGNIDEAIWIKSYENTKEALAINGENPEIYLLLSQTYTIKQDFSNARLAVRQAIAIAPNYKMSYDYAEKLQKLNFDKNFGEYIEGMKSLLALEGK